MYTHSSCIIWWSMTWLWSFIFLLYTALCTANRIMGGQTTSIEQYPSIVQVEFLSQVSGIWTQNCAGSVLNSIYVLSAAQCFSGWNSEAPFRRIRAGSSYRHVGGEIFYVDLAFNHPSYGRNGVDGDISVVRLATRMILKPNIQQATIVLQGSVLPDHLPAIFAGWGRIFSGGPHSAVLRHVRVLTVNQELCAQRYLNLSIPINITENMICAGNLHIGGKDACHDDSGGPMYVNGVVVGIISAGYECGNPIWPSISTAVASYTNWILETAV